MRRESDLNNHCPNGGSATASPLPMEVVMVCDEEVNSVSYWKLS